jgi:hypothetical protein
MSSASTSGRMLVLAVLLGSAASASAQAPRSGGDHLLYLATYSSIYILDERDLTVRDSIPLRSGIPGNMHLNPQRDRFYVRTIDNEHVEVVDLASRRTLDAFTLSQGNEIVRISNMAIHPNRRDAVIVVRRFTKLPDRWEIGEEELLLYDLVGKKTVRTIDRPEGGNSFDFSPDGRFLYFFADEVVVYETAGYTEVDRWEHGLALDQGMGDFQFGFPQTLREEQGWYTGLFNVTDPVHNRRLLSIARVNPTLRRVESFTLGPLEIGPRTRVSFALSADRRRAYGFHQEVANYQLWTFDLEGQRAFSRPLPSGRPRMELAVSSNGQLLYIYNAGNTIDVHDAETLEHLRQVQLDADMLRQLFILPPPSGTRTQSH